MAKARVTNRLPQFVQGVERRVESVMTQALILGAAEAASMTPQDTGTLLNSVIRDVDVGPSTVRGRLSYMAEYSAAVHEAPGKLKGQKRPKVDGKDRGSFWDPRGEPQFLKKGFEQAQPRITALLRGTLRRAKA